ncbi:hypothetical protein YUYDRAFT_01632 [Streptomyces sp. ScaeMP-e48]|uniref:hypothetical protein n=1 Tax=Streptomyces sp. ScaeMP-e48 TaxID=1100823 RepID=UPI000823DB12|nr:hypothetical protein [Streptomyces sp. ScaeMP-e48]SCK17223.1 hypothetical protein YUYDRAFT_01632 [Streptomyces sp. ScaeMP-e48]
MDTQQNTALMRALTELPGPLPARGVIHVVIRHTDRFTVVGNDLAQHPGLSTTAVGFAVRIQSLPQGTEVGIKALAARFPEGEKLIAAALRELETHGYLQRARTRLPNGRIVTRTVFCNQPAALLRPRGAAALPQQAPPAPQVRAPVPASVPAPAPGPGPALAQAPARGPALAPAPKPEHHAPEAPVPEAPAPQAPAPEAPVPQGHASFIPLVPPPTAPKSPRPPLPRPRELTPELERISTALLSDLHHHSPEFTLSEEHVHRLVPGVAAWLERDTHPDTIRHALTTNAPEPVKYPYQFVKHRLTALLPPPPHRTTVTPFQTCDGCERAFRAPTPGHCRDCRTGHAHEDQQAAA